MTISDYIFLLNNPDAVHEKQTSELEKIVQEFPYFQSARALHLKGLYNQDSFKYNYALKVTAAHTSDRSVLFDFVTSDVFAAVDLKAFEEKLSTINDINVEQGEVLNEADATTEALTDTKSEDIEILEISDELPIVALEEEIFEPLAENNTSQTVEEEFEELDGDLSTIYSEEDNQQPKITIDKLEESILNSIRVSSPIIETGEVVEDKQMEELAVEETASADLEIGKPLVFEAGETHSFQEWLQLSKLKPIDRGETEEKVIGEDFRQKKNDLIDRFILTNPKIPPVKSDTPKPTTSVFEASNDPDRSYLMTETLARVYLEQHKYQKAIQAYEILILKYPEKSGFFADRILDIKNLQQK